MSTTYTVQYDDGDSVTAVSVVAESANNAIDLVLAELRDRKDWKSLSHHVWVVGDDLNVLAEDEFITF